MYITPFILGVITNIGALGFEPRTHWLKARRSTTELRTYKGC